MNPSRIFIERPVGTSLLMAATAIRLAGISPNNDAIIPGRMPA